MRLATAPVRMTSNGAGKARAWKSVEKDGCSLLSVIKCLFVKGLCANALYWLLL